MKARAASFIASIDWRILIAASMTGAAGDAVMGYSPMFVGAAFDSLDVSYAAAASITSVEIGVGGATLLLLSPFTGIMRRLRFAYIGLAIFALGAVLAIMAESFDSVFAARALVGVGAGTLAAMNAACIGAARNPERTVATLMVLGLLYMSGAIRLAAEGVGMYGLDGAYAVHLTFALAGGTLYFLIPKAPREGAPWRSALKGADRTVTRGGGSALLPVLMITVFFFVSTSESAVWSFVERKGVAIGLTSAEAGGIISFGFMCGILGALAAIAIGPRLGRAIPVGIGISLFLVGIVMSFGASDAMTYRVGLVIWFIGFVFMMPYMTGAMALIDREGRFVAFAASAGIFANAFGPTIGGLLMDAGDVDAVRTIMPLFVGGCALVLLPVVFKLDRAIKRADVIENV